MLHVTVEESFDMKRRGVAVVFVGSAAGLPLGRALPVRIQRPDGSSIEASATVELLLRVTPQPIERASLARARFWSHESVWSESERRRPTRVATDVGIASLGPRC
jgi:hypothetical protein